MIYVFSFLNHIFYVLTWQQVKFNWSQIPSIFLRLSYFISIPLTHLYLTMNAELQRIKTQAKET